jgi:hypothetical protein
MPEGAVVKGTPDVIGAVVMGSNRCKRSLFPQASLCFRSDTPYVGHGQAAGLSESYPKIGDVPKSPFSTVAALVPSAGTTTFKIELRSGACA